MSFIIVYMLLAIIIIYLLLVVNGELEGNLIDLPTKDKKFLLNRKVENKALSSSWIKERQLQKQIEHWYSDTSTMVQQAQDRLAKRWRKLNNIKLITKKSKPI